jgi:hypothetical protein
MEAILILILVVIFFKLLIDFCPWVVRSKKIEENEVKKDDLCLGVDNSKVNKKSHYEVKTLQNVFSTKNRGLISKEEYQMFLESCDEDVASKNTSSSEVVMSSDNECLGGNFIVGVEVMELRVRMITLDASCSKYAKTINIIQDECTFENELKEIMERYSALSLTFNRLAYVRINRASEVIKLTAELKEMIIKLQFSNNELAQTIAKLRKKGRILSDYDHLSDRQAIKERNPMH